MGAAHHRGDRLPRDSRPRSGGPRFRLRMNRRSELDHRLHPSYLQRRQQHRRSRARWQRGWRLLDNDCHAHRHHRLDRRGGPRHWAVHCRCESGDKRMLSANPPVQPRGFLGATPRAPSPPDRAIRPSSGCGIHRGVRADGAARAPDTKARAATPRTSQGSGRTGRPAASSCLNARNRAESLRAFPTLSTSCSPPRRQRGS
jgi:hypothetical protein